MADSSIYNPNDTGCMGWKGEHSVRPPLELDMQYQTELTEGELDTISVDDDNALSYQTNVYPYYPGHHIRFQISEAEGDVTQLALTFKGYGVKSATYEYYLYIWNFGTPAWEYLDNHTTASKDTVTGSISSDMPDYIDDNGYVHALVMGPVSSPPPPFPIASIIYTHYGELEVTYEGAAPPALQSQVLFIGPWK